jgi:hypothetical protein
VWEFNWGVFWALLAALLVKAVTRFLWTLWRVGSGFRSLNEYSDAISRERSGY